MGHVFHVAIAVLCVDGELAQGRCIAVFVEILQNSLVGGINRHILRLINNFLARFFVTGELENGDSPSSAMRITQALLNIFELIMLRYCEGLLQQITVVIADQLYARSQSV